MFIILFLLCQVMPGYVRFCYCGDILGHRLEVYIELILIVVSLCIRKWY